MSTFIQFIAISLTVIMTSSAFAQQSAYFRDPSLHANKVVFTSQGDLWLADTQNTAPARRLTTHPSIEQSAIFSPTGDQVAFVARYSNVPAVHVINVQGGIAKQVSFELSSTKLHAWIDNSTLLVSTASSAGMHSSWVLKTINIDTLATNTLPLSDAVEGAMTKNGSTLVFVQHGLQVSTDNANHYKGGAAGKLWRYTMGSNKEAVQLTANHQGSVRTPMFYKGRVYFISNQNKLDNLWSMDLDGKDLVQHTSFEDWAMRGASIYNNTIIFGHGGDLKTYNIDSSQTATLNISLQSDFADLRTQYIKKPLEYLENATLSGDADKVVITARGRIAIADTDTTRLVEVATDPSSRNRQAMLSHDGEHVYAISDVSGDYEIWQFDAKGKKESKRLTQNGFVLRTGMWLSPNGEQLVHSDSSGKLWQLDLASLDNKLIADDLSGGLRDLVFSADSRYITFAYSVINSDRARIYVKDLETGKGAFVSSEKYSSYSPVFSTDMNWLYFLSDRSFRGSPSSPWGDRNMGTRFNDRTQLFAVSLTDDATFPFAPPTELSADDSEKDKNAKEDDDENENEEKASKALVLDQISERLWQIDIPAGNYSNIFASKKHLFITAEDKLHSLAFEYDAKLDEVTSGVSSVEMSSDSKSLLVRKGNRDSAKFYVIEAKPSFPKDASNAQVKLTSWILAIDPKQEWQQIFKDAWLMHRDGLFDANMRGLDWPATKLKYLPLVARVTERSELNDIFEQMMGELNALHSQVRGGDISSDENAPVQSILGGRYEDTREGIKIAHIYGFEKELLNQAPPLAQPGVNAQPGDIISAVNGQAVMNQAQLHQALLNRSGEQVLLDLTRDKVDLQTVVYPVSSNREARYRYQDWVMRNYQKVQSTEQNIGYLHLFAMGGNDLASFARDFYAQNKKQGLIIDVRRNRGGSIDSILIEKLLRRAWSFWQSPNGEKSTNMQNAFRGHLVVLADQFTYSDGETFTAGIKALELGTVIGKKTAGAGVWLSGGNQVVDRGIARVAQFPVFAMDGRWITEGEGISPHVEVTNMPHATFKGQDAQLDAAIALLQKKMKEDPVVDYKALPFGPVKQPAYDILPSKN
jgi:tricorn protease